MVSKEVAPQPLPKVQDEPKAHVGIRTSDPSLLARAGEATQDRRFMGRRRRHNRPRHKGRQWHHDKAVSRGGDNSIQNLILLDATVHANLHLVFGNRSLDEIIAILVRLRRMKGRQREGGSFQLVSGVPLHKRGKDREAKKLPGLVLRELRGVVLDFQEREGQANEVSDGNLRGVQEANPRTRSEGEDSQVPLPRRVPGGVPQDFE